MTLQVTVIIQGQDPKSGGISREGYEFTKISDIKNIFDLYKILPNKTAFDYILNFLSKKEWFFKSNLSNFGDIIHFLNYSMAPNKNIFTNKKVLITLHEAEFAPAGRGFRTHFRNYLNGISKRKFFYWLNHADFLVVNSTQTYNRLLNLYNLKKEKIVVINLGVDNSYKPLNKEDSSDDIGYVGGFGPHKRVEKLIKDFIDCSNKESNLKIAGRLTSQASKDFSKYTNNKRISFLGPIDESYMVNFYNSLKYFVSPTSHEGFGLPILEAVACGIPTFIYYDADITEEVAKYAIKIHRLEEIYQYDYSYLKKEFLKKSNEVRYLYSWNKMIEKTIELYRSLL